MKRRTQEATGHSMVDRRIIGLVHGRFQPFHLGHKFLIDWALEECDEVVVLVAFDEGGQWTLEQRFDMLWEEYHSEIRLGCNPTRPQEGSWERMFIRLVYGITGQPITDVYGGPDYGVEWKDYHPALHLAMSRYKNISGTDIRASIDDFGHWLPGGTKVVLSEQLVLDTKHKAWYGDTTKRPICKVQHLRI